MEILKNDILSCLESMSDYQKKSLLERFVNVFYNRRESGNRAIIMGCKDDTAIKNILGISADKLINDNKSFLVRIRRVKRPDQEKVVISFNVPEGGFQDDKKKNVKSIFGYYGDTKVNLDVCFENQSIPDLEIKRNINDFINDEPDGLISLSANNMIKSITISSSLQGGNNVLSSIDDMFIIPMSYRPLVLDSIRTSSNESADGIDFWSNFENNVYGFNFIILNNENDHLIRIFVDLVEKYRQYFNIKQLNANLLRRLFYITDKEYLKNSRASSEMIGDKIQEYEDFHQSPNEIDRVWKDVELYSGTLDRLIGSNEVDELSSLAEFEKFYCDSIANTKKNVSNAISFVKESVASFPEKYKYIDEKIKELSGSLSKFGKIDRQMILSEIKDFYKNLIEFSELYCPRLLQQIVEGKSFFESKEKDFLEPAPKIKKVLTFGFREHNMNEGNFTSILYENVVKPIGHLWMSEVSKSIDLSDWKEINKIEDDTRSICKLITEKVESMSRHGLFEYGMDFLKFKSEEEKIFNELGDLYSSISLLSLNSHSFKNDLGKILDQWSEIIKNMSPIPELKIGKILSDVKCEYQIKILLIDRMNELLSTHKVE